MKYISSTTKLFRFRVQPVAWKCKPWLIVIIQRKPILYLDICRYRIDIIYQISTNSFGSNSSIQIFDVPKLDLSFQNLIFITLQKRKWIVNRLKNCKEFPYSWTHSLKLRRKLSIQTWIKNEAFLRNCDLGRIFLE